MSTVTHMQTGYSFLDDRRKRTDTVTRVDDIRARMEEEVAELSTTAHNQDK